MLHPLDGKYMAQYEALVTNWSADVIEMAVEKGVLPSFVTALRVRETPDEAYESSEIHKPFLHPKEWWSLDDLTETMINAHGVPDGSVSTWRDALVTEISR